MKKVIRVGIVFAIILSFIIGFIFCVIRIKGDELGLEERLDYVVDLILSEEIKVLSDRKVEELKIEIEEVLDNSINNKIVCKSNFILGYIDAINLNTEEAINKFNNSITLFGNISDSEMKARAYYELSKIYLSLDEYAKSNEIFYKMIDMCEQEGARKEIVKLSILRCDDLYSTPNGLKKSIELMEETLSLAKELKSIDVVDVYHKLGILYWYDNREIEAINCKLEALVLAEENNLKKKALDIEVSIGMDYLNTGNYSEAIMYFKKVLSNELENEDKAAESKGVALLYLAECFSNIGDYESADKAFEMLDENLYQIINRVYMEDSITYMYAIKADLESRKGNPKEALRLLEEAKSRFSEKSRFSFYNFDIKIIEELGDAYYMVGNYEIALKYHKEAKVLAKKRDLVYLEISYNDKLYLDYKALGDDENTIKYLEINNDLKTKVKDNQNRQYSQFLITKYEKDKSLEKISQLESHQNIMKALIIGLFSISGIIGVFTCFIFKKNKEISRLNKLFKNLSITDGLTKLPNRRALDEYLAGNWSLYKKTYMPISFVMIDIDYFKNYNDNYGHPEGDKVLKEIATSISSSCRNSDFVARYGGEEFTIIMLNTDKPEAIKVVDRIQEDIYRLNIKHEYSPVSDRISLSIGIATAHVGSIKEYDEYIKKADTALYKAKESGRNTYIYLSNAQ